MFALPRLMRTHFNASIRSSNSSTACTAVLNGTSLPSIIPLDVFFSPLTSLCSSLTHCAPVGSHQSISFPD
jgi:hypothetical protein